MSSSNLPIVHYTFAGSGGQSGGTYTVPGTTTQAVGTCGHGASSSPLSFTPSQPGDESAGIELPEVRIKSWDRGAKITLVYTPESSITAYEVSLVNMLVLAELYSTGDVHVLGFVRDRGLGRHFTIKQGWA